MNRRILGLLLNDQGIGLSQETEINEYMYVALGLSQETDSPRGKARPKLSKSLKP